MSLKLIPESLRCGFKEPTPIQDKAIPLILEGKNLLLVAPTGSGKTEAAILPVLTLYLRFRKSKEWKPGIYVVYITPLRALNRDMLERLRELCGRVSVKVEVRHGDTPRRIRILQAKAPPEVLITTPETLQVILGTRSMRRWLKTVKWIIVDEVHSLIGNKRGAQLAVALERIKRRVKHEIQFIGLSATLGSPEEALKFIVGVKGEGMVVDGSASKKYEISVNLCKPSEEDFKLAEKIQSTPRFASRIRKIYNLTSKSNSTLIFANCREHVEFISSRLRILGLKVASHHSSLSGDSRSEAEKMLKQGNLKGVVCTSSLELGIDVGEVDLCIQHLSPRSPTSLLQRTGRSGHSLYKVSRGVILAGGSDDFLEASVVARMALERRLEKTKVEELALDVLAHQIAGIALDNDGIVEIEEVFDIVSSSYPYRKLKFHDLIELTEYIASLGLINFDGKYLKPNRKTRKYYFKHVSTIPEEIRYPVFEEETGSLIGHLGEDFYATYGKPGVKLILKGSPWIISRIEGFNIYVKRAEDYLAAIPGWEGEVLPTPFEVASEIGILRRNVEKFYHKGVGMETMVESVSSTYPADREDFYEALKPLYDHLHKSYPLPTDKRILVESFEDYAVIHVCGGHGVNRCLAKILSYLLKEKIGIDPIVRWDAYRILIMSHGLLKAKTLADFLKNIDLRLCKRILWDSVDSYILRHIALKFDAIPGSLYYKSASYLITLPDKFKNTPIYKEAFRFQLKHHYDYDNFKKIIKNLNNGRIEVDVLENLPDPTPLARPILDLSEAAYLSNVDLFKEKLFNKRVLLVCLDCLYTSILAVKDFQDNIVCIRCGSKSLALVKWKKEETLKALRKIKNHMKLDEQEEKLILNVQMSSDLIRLYGKRAVIALSVTGVGPLTAYPILAKKHRKEEEFLNELKKAMREYFETRDYWSSDS